MSNGVGRVVVGLGVLVCLKRRVIPASLLGWAPAFAGATLESLWERDRHVIPAQTAIRLSVAEYRFCGMSNGVGRLVVGLHVLVCLKCRMIPTSLLGWAPAFAGATRELLWARALLCSVIYLGHTCAKAIRLNAAAY